MDGIQRTTGPGPAGDAGSGGGAIGWVPSEKVGVVPWAESTAVRVRSRA